MRCVVFAFDQNRNLLWDREILDNSSPYKIMQLNAILESDLNSLIAIGFIIDTNSVTNMIIPDKNIWLLKLDSLGCFNSNCFSSEIITQEVYPNKIKDYFIIFPIPTDHTLYINQPNNKYSGLEIKILSIQSGSLQYYTSSSANNNESIKIDIDHLPDGIYLLQIYKENKLLENKKVIVMH